MPTAGQMLADYPETLLQVIAELRGALVEAADTKRETVDLLAAQIAEPISITMAYQELADDDPQAQTALETLLKAGGEMTEAQFSRDYGSVRQMGPARLEREMPWTQPESTAELLYYHGLLGRGIKGAGQNAHTIVYIPSDVVPWLPQPAVAGENSLPFTPVPPPPATRTLASDDTFLEDTGTLLGFLHTDRLRLTEEGPDPEDVGRLAARLQSAGTEEDNESGVPTEGDVRLALLFHLAKRLGWLRRGDDNLVVLTGNRVRAFLDMNRTEQRLALWQAWRQSTEWDDLCRLPALECEPTGNWQNDPLQTRKAILDLLRQLQPGTWYSQSDVIQTIRQHHPDFQRPTGDYESWYLRSNTTQEFLKGFDHWDDVEGELLRFLFRNTLHWLGALDLAEPSAGDDLQISLSQWGARWLGHDSAQPDELPHRSFIVHEDFTVILPEGTPLLNRFRVERFAQWQASQPHFVYRITQRGLLRAAEEGITPHQVLEFLQRRTRQLPAKVTAALERFEQRLDTPTG